ncbi:hypothetical protein LX32DRAFT_640682 [Colletotrichum zoysiae]|uniref:Uncharacterized protein n=1 Tax=Colletotrichum zoysiae TaxID=1216348 RepID=A0AAD9HEQ7_9PEZI|nr:hypothetical protein LX32DRAFT_640682 [Colletotrichum zoysiae]
MKWGPRRRSVPPCFAVTSTKPSRPNTQPATLSHGPIIVIPPRSQGLETQKPKEKVNRQTKPTTHVFLYPRSLGLNPTKPLRQPRVVNHLSPHLSSVFSTFCSPLQTTPRQPARLSLPEHGSQQPVFNTAVQNYTPTHRQIYQTLVPSTQMPIFASFNHEK